MEKLLWVALIMALSLNGCACYGTCALIKEDLADYWDELGAGVWKVTKQDLADFFE